jgi:hypothetical protein
LDPQYEGVPGAFAAQDLDPMLLSEETARELEKRLRYEKKFKTPLRFTLSEEETHGYLRVSSLEEEE